MGAPRAVALCRNFGGVLDFQDGSWPSAEAQLRESVDLYRRIGSASGESLSLQRLGVLLTARGRLDEALEAMQEGLFAAERATMRSHCLTRLFASLARNRLAAGDLEEAERNVREGDAAARRHGNCVTCNALLLPEAVRVRVARGQLDEAETSARELEELAGRSGSRAWTAMSRQARGRILAARGRADEALAALEEARRAYEAYGAVYEVARCEVGIAEILATRDPARARALRARAGEVFAAVGAAGLER
jgi:tetratricopeptide (TPR) repeat protein